MSFEGNPTSCGRGSIWSRDLPSWHARILRVGRGTDKVGEMGVAEALPLLEFGEHVELLGLLVEDGLPEDVLLGGLAVLKVGEVVLLDPALNGEHLGELLLIGKGGLVRLTHS